MRIFWVLSLIVFVTMTSCATEDCPPPQSTTTLNFTVSTAPNMLQQRPLEKTIKSLELFLMNEKKNNTIGPFKLNIAQAYRSATLIDETPGNTGDDSMYRFSVTEKLPYGEYKMWVWVNVSDPEIYSFDKFTISQKDDTPTGYYMLAKASNISITSITTTIDVSEILRLCAPVSLAVNDNGKPVSNVSLLLSSVCKTVSADMEYGTTGTLEYSQPKEGILPTTVYLFQSESPCEITYTYKRDGVTGTESTTIPALDRYDSKSYTFNIM